MCRSLVRMRDYVLEKGERKFVCLYRYNALKTKMSPKVRIQGKFADKGKV